MKYFHSSSQIIHKRVLFIAAMFLFASGILNAQQAKTHGQIVAAHPDWVQVPGEIIRPECVHQIPLGAKVEVGEDGSPTGDVSLKGQVFAHFNACSDNAIITRSTLRNLGHTPLPCQHPPCKIGVEPDVINGWVEGATWCLADPCTQNLDEMYGEWTVPNKPSENNGQLIYLFNGLESPSSDGILQPVLQYGSSPAGGGYSWAIASWAVFPNYVYVSPLASVNPGDEIVGYTVLGGILSGNTLAWDVIAYDSSTGAVSGIDVSSSGGQWQTALAGVLEVYGVNTCSELPFSGGYTQFVNNQLYDGYPSYNYMSDVSWFGEIYQGLGLKCGFNVAAGPGYGSTATLYY